MAAGVLTMCGGHLNVFGLQSPGYPVEPYSPTLALGAPTLMAIVVVLALRWRGQALSGAVWLVPVLSVVAGGTKGSTIPLVVAGLGLAVVAMLVFDRSRVRTVLLDLAIVAGALIFTFVVVFHGSSAGLAFGLPERPSRPRSAPGWAGCPPPPRRPSPSSSRSCP